MNKKRVWDRSSYIVSWVSEQKTGRTDGQTEWTGWYPFHFLRLIEHLRCQSICATFHAVKSSWNRNIVNSVDSVSSLKQWYLHLFHKTFQLSFQSDSKLTKCLANYATKKNQNNVKRFPKQFHRYYSKMVKTLKYFAQRNVKTLKSQSSPTVRTANYCPSLFSGKIDLLFSWSTRWWRGELHFIVRNSIQCSTLFEQSGCE